MTLKTRLMEDLKRAMREGDEVRKSTIRMVRAAIVNAEKEAGKPLDDEGVIAVLQREVKRRRDAIAAFEQGGREDLAAKERAELAVLEAYLPRMLTPQEIEAAAKEVIAEVGAKGMGDMGPVMRTLMGRLKGRADGRQVSEIVRRLLAGTS